MHSPPSAVEYLLLLFSERLLNVNATFNEDMTALNVFHRATGTRE